ncbi:MAG: DPP IV N-terminal domain-containing protein [Balneolaceae bacterium]|nr:DPP IV N-terminal domain-containing protein [Balneolaceae bacterium]
MNSIHYGKQLVIGLACTLALLFGAQPATAQQGKANYELAERFTSDNMQKMTGSTSVWPRWIDETNDFWYTYETQEGNYWWYVDAEEETKRPLFDRQRMAAELTEMFNRTYNHKDLDLDEFNYDVDEETFTFRVDSIRLHYDIDTQELVRGDTLREDEEDENLPWATYSPDSTWIAFARDHNLYLMEADDPDSTEYQLTTSGERFYSFAADEEDTSSSGERVRSIAQWFEDGEKLWVKRQDWRRVEDLWVIRHVGVERPQLETYKYAMPGEDEIPQDEIWAFDTGTKDGVQLDTDKPEWEDESLGGVYFNNGGIYEGESSDYLYILRRNRPWDTIDVLKANTSTGETEVLWTETAKPYFNTRFAQLAVLNEGEDLIWWSERTGWGQFYLYDGEGNLQNRITEGYFTAGNITKIDTTGRTLFFGGYGREESVHPYHNQLYKVNFDGSGMERLTGEAANHQVFASEEDDFFVDNYSTVSTAPRSVLRNSDGEIIMELEATDLSRLMEAGYTFPESFKVKANDDATDLFGVMWKPFDFDSTKSYPIIAYCYPGPQTEPFPTDFSLSSQQALANLGFVVVALGQRGGSPIRSKYYHNYGYDDMRDYPLADNKYGIEQLASRHDFIDQDRVGIYGHSGGGFMSTAALLTYPDFYDVAVSTSGNHDNNIYNLWWGEVHNGVSAETRTIKVENEEGEEVDSTITEWDGSVDANMELAPNLKGHLMLATGMIDNNVHPAGTIRMAEALIQAGKSFDFVLLPGQRHGYGGIHGEWFDRVRWRYFAEHLLGDYRPDAIDINIPADN